MWRGERRWFPEDSSNIDFDAQMTARDNALYQRCHLVQQLAATRRIELLFLPACSLNLNLIKRLWKFVKKTTINSRHYPNFKEFQAAIDQCLDQVPTLHRPEINTLMNLSFQTFENVSILNA